MPLSKYFKGHGKEVMSDMTSRYGSDQGKRVFYATANKRGLTADAKKKRLKRKRKKRQTIPSDDQQLI